MTHFKIINKYCYYTIIFTQKNGNENENEQKYEHDHEH